MVTTKGYADGERMCENAYEKAIPEQKILGKKNGNQYLSLKLIFI